MTDNINDLIHLPINFQEVVISSEMEFQNEITVDTSNKLLYVYTLGIDFYHHQSKEKFEAFYCEKKNELLSNSTVKEYIDKQLIDIKNQNILMIFPNYDRINFRNKDEGNKPNNNNNSIKKPKSKEYQIKVSIKKSINKVDIAIEKARNEIIKDMKIQKETFEERKREKLKKRNITVNSSYMRIMRYNLMLMEIERLVDDNMTDMFKAVDDLSISYNQEILGAIENGFPDIASALREDLEVEIENLKLLYEEERLNQTEIIRKKYKRQLKKRSYITE